MTFNNRGEITVLLCTYTGTRANWAVELPEHMDSAEQEAIDSISFEGGAIRLFSTDGDEYPLPDAMYDIAEEARGCESHSITQFDSFGNIGKIYEVGIHKHEPVRAFGV